MYVILGLRFLVSREIERHGRAMSTKAYFGGPGFTSGHGDRLDGRFFFWCFESLHADVGIIP